MIRPRHHDIWSTNNTVVLPLHDVIILRKQNDQRGWHWVRSPGWLIVVEFLFGQKDSKKISLLLVAAAVLAAAAAIVYAVLPLRLLAAALSRVAQPSPQAAAVAAAVAAGRSRRRCRRRRLPSPLPLALPLMPSPVSLGLWDRVCRG